MSESNDFFNYVLDSFNIFKRQDGITLKQAWELYNNYNAEARVQYPMGKRSFK